jgi:hypothetical protein
MRERIEALAHMTYFVAMPSNRDGKGDLVAGEAALLVPLN